MTKPKTLTDLKRYLHPGIEIEMIKWHSGKGVPEKCKGKRKIKTVQSNAITFLTKGIESWLYFEKAGNYTFSETGFIVKDNFGDTLEYKY